MPTTFNQDYNTVSTINRLLRVASDWLFPLPDFDVYLI